MLANLFTKSLRDRWMGTTVGMAVVGLLLVMAMAAYQDIDISLYADLPESMRSVMGIPDDAEPATLAYHVILGLIGAMTLSGLAMSMGASSVAGEERDGTIGLLLANPKSRREVLVGKGAAMVLLLAAGALVTLGASYLAPALLSVDIGDAHVPAVVVHFFCNALVWGSLATAVSAVTGNRSLAVSAPAGVMVICYFLVGLLPLFASMAGAARVLPWYWFDGHDPLNNGISGRYLALQVGVTVALFGVSWWGVESRDLTKGSGSQSLLVDIVDRIRRDERAARIVDRLSGRAHVGSIWVKTVAEGQVLVLIIAAVVFFLMGLLMGPMYAALEDTLATAADFPENLLAIAGGGDMTTPEGWFRLETFGLMTPIAVTLAAAAVGVRALAGEEHSGTMGLLLANPISRRRVVLEKFVAVVIHAGIVGVATFAGVSGGSLLGGLGMSIANIAAAALQVTLLGIMFGALALAIGAATGRVRAATIGTIAAFAGAYATNAVLSVAEGLDAWRRLSPFEWYLEGDPLVNGVDWSAVALLVGFTVALVALSIALFDRRDLQRG